MVRIFHSKLQFYARIRVYEAARDKLTCGSDTNRGLWFLTPARGSLASTLSSFRGGSAHGQTVPTWELFVIKISAPDQGSLEIPRIVLHVKLIVIKRRCRVDS